MFSTLPERSAPSHLMDSRRFDRGLQTTGVTSDDSDRAFDPGLPGSRPVPGAADLVRFE